MDKAIFALLSKANLSITIATEDEATPIKRGDVTVIPLEEVALCVLKSSSFIKSPRKIEMEWVWLLWNDGQLYVKPMG